MKPLHGFHVTVAGRIRERVSGTTLVSVLVQPFDRHQVPICRRMIWRQGSANGASSSCVTEVVADAVMLPFLMSCI